MFASSNFGLGRQVFGESVRGFKWVCEEYDERAVLNIIQKLKVPEILAKILYSRGVYSVEDAEQFLDPKLRNLLPNPFEMRDMDKASKRIADAIIKRERITVFGDYDVDGATSSALLKKFFRFFDIDINIYIPNRMAEGYGPSVEAFSSIIESGAQLIITVDCGTVSFEPIDYAQSKGIDVVVLDHHLSTEVLPNAYAIVNPNRFDDDFHFKFFAAVGVAFMMTVAVKATLKNLGHFDQGCEEPNLLTLLDLVALGTVCDVMNLSGPNRAFVAQGLKFINKRLNPGIASLVDISKISSSIHSHHLGYILGPRINAGGRVGLGMHGPTLLSSEIYEDAFEIATELEKLNEDRKAIEALTLESALQQIESNNLDSMPIIMVEGNNWHQGILGIIASRLKEKYSKPAFVISNAEGLGKGSVRSIHGIDIGSFLAKSKSEGLLVTGGGHAMAGGFLLETSKIPDFYKSACNAMKGKEECYTKARELSIDAIIPTYAVNGALAQQILRAAPFGSGNPVPKFMLKDVFIVTIKVIAKSHLMLIVSESSSHKASHTIKCMLFKSVGTEMEYALRKAYGQKISLLGSIQMHYLDSKKADFVIDDIIV